MPAQTVLLFAAPAAARVSAAIANPDVSAAAAAHMLTWEDALWLATAGGAAALGLSDKVGHFAVGMEFDALLVDAGKPEVFDLLDAAHGDAPLAMLEHFWSNGDDRNIVAVYVQGQVCTP
jgi:guanine deaminase